MTEAKILLALREKIKSKKPEFIRQESERAKISEVWRKPKGIHSKMRHHIRGKRKMPSPGYGSPVEVKGLHSSGLIPIIVYNTSQIPSSKEYGIIIGSTVGMKKKAGIIEKAGQLGIRVLNIDVDVYMKKFGELVASKKKKSEQIQKEKSPKKTEEKKEEKKSKEEEKAEMDRILTKKV